jgi:hypothetical protein
VVVDFLPKTVEERSVTEETVAVRVPRSWISADWIYIFFEFTKTAVSNLDRAMKRQEKATKKKWKVTYILGMGTTLRDTEGALNCCRVICGSRWIAHDEGVVVFR